MDSYSLLRNDIKIKQKLDKTNQHRSKSPSLSSSSGKRLDSLSNSAGSNVEFPVIFPANTVSTTHIPTKLPSVYAPSLSNIEWKKKKERANISPVVAWPETNSASLSSLKKRANKPNSEEKVLDLQSDVASMKNKVFNARSEENYARLRIIKKAEDIVHKMPLKYLFSKPELRNYAFEVIAKPLVNLAMYRIHLLLQQAFRKWVTVRHMETLLNEKQIGFMVIAKRLLHLLNRVYSIKFMHWAMLYSNRYSVIRLERPYDAAMTIQRWYRHMRVVTREPFSRLAKAIQHCLHRRRAIKHLIEFEMSRRQAMNKVKRGIIQRRRLHFAARSIQRVLRWWMLFRKTRWRLTRIRAARKLQEWIRMMFCRSETELLLIRLVSRCGGYSIVNAKIPTKHRSRGFLPSIDACISQLQRAWFTSKGSFALFMKFAARKAHMEHQKLLNDSATIIANSYKAHLWNQLMKAAVQNNRARRIQRGFRAYQYRCWVDFMVQQSYHRFARRLQKFLGRLAWLKYMKNRFLLRKSLIIFLRAKRLISAIYIQRAYRAHAERERIRKEELRKFYASQRAQGDFVLNTISKIQRNWRQMKLPGKYSHHVLLLMKRLDAKRRRRFNLNALIIQKLVKQYIKKIQERKMKKQVKAANIMWTIFKAYLLRLALWDRVEATRLRKWNGSNFIKKWIRNRIWLRRIRIRFSIMRSRLHHQCMRDYAARIIQLNFHRKFVEYYSALRVAGRTQLHKRRKREEEERILAIRNHAASVIQRLFRGNSQWIRTLRRINVQRTELRQRRSSKRIQKLIRSFLAWARFRRAIKAKYDRIEAERIRQLETKACNIIGYYWRRKKELKTLKMRFDIRKQMLDVYKDLKAKREKAEADREEAMEDVRRTEENMQATINAAWKQGSDTNGRNYYYNYVTGESTWNPPENWQSKVMDVYVRNVDERGNIYYYNMQTGESQWLPPCCTCGEDSQRWCMDCNLAYCEVHYDLNHAHDADESMQNHTWSAVEYEKEKLKQGEIYCMECKRRAAKKVCTTCWDSYCDECFKLVHHVGALRYHKSITYRKAKMGWTCVKGRMAGEQDYFVHGTTGETTYEKPEELMTDQEKYYYSNFKVHREKAEELVQKVDKLQTDLEEANYERDSILYEAMSGNGNIASILRRREKNGKPTDPKNPNEEPKEDVLGDAMRKASRGGGFFSFFSGIDSHYRQKIMRPSGRARGQDRSNYIKSLIDDGEPAKK